MGGLKEFKANETTIVQTVVVLLRNTTWRCGKLERSIVTHLRNRRQNFGRSEVSVFDIMHHLDIKGDKKEECIDAIKRLEKRNIVRILPL